MVLELTYRMATPRHFLKDRRYPQCSWDSMTQLTTLPCCMCRVRPVHLSRSRQRWLPEMGRRSSQLRCHVIVATRNPKHSNETGDMDATDRTSGHSGITYTDENPWGWRAGVRRGRYEHPLGVWGGKSSQLAERVPTGLRMLVSRRSTAAANFENKWSHTYGTILISFNQTCFL